ncbi:MAG TPA: transglycosylase SLT domain-containing protein [Nitrospirales bacterium]|nr:transglycosylase SLT domain-containing protein [Nitrospirales bacterium]
MKLDRLRQVQERHPGSVWAKRAALVSGLTLLDRDPSEAMRSLRAAQRDFPLLADYVRLWLGEGHFKAGDFATAAKTFETVSDTLPETSLIARAAYRAGDAWSKAGECARAIPALMKATQLAPQEPAAPSAFLVLADCQAKAGRRAEAIDALEQLWVRYPNTPEAREAAQRLTANGTGQTWKPGPDALYERASNLLTLAFPEDAVEEFRRFLAAGAQHPKRDDARSKLGTALVRLKRYDQARDTFLALAAGNNGTAGEALVSLGKIYLRQGDGDRLLALTGSMKLSPDQRATIWLYAGTWLEDQGKPDQALVKYQAAAREANGSGQRADALWRIGWLQYRDGRYAEALATLTDLVAGKEDPQWTPQALYWHARTREQLKDPAAAEGYADVCRRYPFTYYCLLVQAAARVAGAIALPVALPTPELADARTELSRDLSYLRARELKALGLEEDAARELAPLLERAPRGRDQLIELSMLLSDAGATHQALRLVRLYFRDPLERGGDPLPAAVWTAGYPTIYLPLIRNYGSPSFDPLLAAAIIREESQYDPRALSRVGAVGLMQLMPATAQAVGRRYGVSDVGRDDLFDQETNIRFGVRYLDQLLEQFGGNIIHAVAAYNAGPNAVQSWIGKFGSKGPDEFVELIPYQETRQYVKRVLRSYREYRRLAGVACAVRSLDKVC